MATVAGMAVLLVWIGLLATGFWLCAERDDRAARVIPAQWPSIVAVVPARDEADVIARSLRSLAAQNYPGNFRVILVDDNSSDATAEIARAISSSRVTVLRGAPLAAGWTGKLWALSQGIAMAGTPDFLWLTDADIAHAPDTLCRLVEIAAKGNKSLVSFMARLRCETWPERAFVPAFVYFFMMLYPFNWINRGPISGAAGGCVLVRRDAIETAGGIEAIKGALIDDCALGALIKRRGPIWLGLTRRSCSIRPYQGVGEIAAMISRSAYAQLHFHPLLLAATVAGLAVLFGLPLLVVVLAQGTGRLLGLVAVALMLFSYQPVLRFYRRSPLWGLGLPAVAAFYGWCTVASAWQHHRGRGGMWKGRAQALAGR